MIPHKLLELVTFLWNIFYIWISGDDDGRPGGGVGSIGLFGVGSIGFGSRVGPIVGLGIGSIGLAGVDSISLFGAGSTLGSSQCCLCYQIGVNLSTESINCGMVVDSIMAYGSSSPLASDSGPREAISRAC